MQSENIKIIPLTLTEWEGIQSENDSLKTQLTAAEARAEAAEKSAANLREELQRHYEIAHREITCQSQRATAAESRAERMRAALEAVEKWMESEDGPIYRLWEDTDICAYDNAELTWEQALAEVRDTKIDAVTLGHGVKWEAITLYREILAALNPPDCQRQLALGGEEGEGK